MKPATVVEWIAVGQSALSGEPDALRWSDAGFPLEALSRPSFRPHLLKGDRKGFRAVRGSSDWRIVVRLERSRVFDGDLVNYQQGVNRE